jgi:hypothetical protein
VDAPARASKGRGGKGDDKRKQKKGGKKKQAVCVPSVVTSHENDTCCRALAPHEPSLRISGMQSDFKIMLLVNYCQDNVTSSPISFALALLSALAQDSRGRVLKSCTHRRIRGWGFGIKAISMVAAAVVRAKDHVFRCIGELTPMIWPGMKLM